MNLRTHYTICKCCGKLALINAGLCQLCGQEFGPTIPVVETVTPHTVDFVIQQYEDQLLAV